MFTSLQSVSIKDKKKKQQKETEWSGTPQGSFIFTETCLTEVKLSRELNRMAKTRPLVRNYSAH